MMMSDYPERDTVSPEDYVLISTENGTKNVKISAIEKYIKDPLLNLFPGISRLVPTQSSDEIWIPNDLSDTNFITYFQKIYIPKSIVKKDGQYLAIIDVEFEVDMKGNTASTPNKLYYDFNASSVLSNDKSVAYPEGVNIFDFLYEGHVERNKVKNRFRGKLDNKNVSYIFSTILFASSFLKKPASDMASMKQYIQIGLNTETTGVYMDSDCRVKPRIKKAYLLGPISGPIFDASVSIG